MAKRKKTNENESKPGLEVKHIFSGMADCESTMSENKSKAYFFNSIKGILEDPQIEKKLDLLMKIFDVDDEIKPKPIVTDINLLLKEQQRILVFNELDKATMNLMCFKKIDEGLASLTNAIITALYDEGSVFVDEQILVIARDLVGKIVINGRKDKSIFDITKLRVIKALLYLLEIKCIPTRIFHSV